MGFLYAVGFLADLFVRCVFFLEGCISRGKHAICVLAHKEAPGSSVCTVAGGVLLIAYLCSAVFTEIPSSKFGRAQNQSVYQVQQQKVFRLFQEFLFLFQP